MILEDKVQPLHLHVLQRAKQLGNVSVACREVGISRTLRDCWKKRLTLYGIDGPHPRQAAALSGCCGALGVPASETLLLEQRRSQLRDYYCVAATLLQIPRPS